MAVVLAAAVSPLLVLPFGWFQTRAAVLPGRTLTVRQVGMVEVANSAVLLAVLAALC